MVEPPLPERAGNPTRDHGDAWGRHQFTHGVEPRGGLVQERDPLGGYRDEQDLLFASLEGHRGAGLAQARLDGERAGIDPGPTPRSGTEFREVCREAVGEVHAGACQAALAPAAGPLPSPGGLRSPSMRRSSRAACRDTTTRSPRAVIAT